MKIIKNNAYHTKSSQTIFENHIYKIYRNTAYKKMKIIDRPRWEAFKNSILLVWTKLHSFSWFSKLNKKNYCKDNGFVKTEDLEKLMESLELLTDKE